MLGPLVNDGKLNNRKQLLHEEKKGFSVFFVLFVFAELISRAST